MIINCNDHYDTLYRVPPGFSGACVKKSPINPSMSSSKFYATSDTLLYFLKQKRNEMSLVKTESEIRELN